MRMLTDRNFRCIAEHLLVVFSILFDNVLAFTMCGNQHVRSMEDVQQTIRFVYQHITGAGTHEKLDAELVYQLTKQLFEHKADLVAVSSKMSEMTPEAIKSIQIPIHPGAEKYYREIGIMK